MIAVLIVNKVSFNKQPVLDEPVVHVIQGSVANNLNYEWMHKHSYSKKIWTWYGDYIWVGQRDSELVQMLKGILIFIP